jgi:hypothetical protein
MFVKKIMRYKMFLKIVLISNKIRAFELFFGLLDIITNLIQILCFEIIIFGVSFKEQTK